MPEESGLKYQQKMTKMKIWFLAARPKTLWAAVSPVIIGCALAYADNGWHWLSALASLFGAVMIQIGTNFANDYADFKKGTDAEERLGPVRVTQAGLVKPEVMKKATAFVFGLAVLAGFYLVWRGGWPVVVIGLLSILFGILYTSGPYPLGYNGLGEIFVLIFFGPVAVGGTYYVQTFQINTTVLLLGLSPGLFSIAILTVNNLRDIKGDKKAGKKTLAVRFGAGFARFQYVFSVVVAVVIPSLLYFYSSERVYSLISLITLLAAVPVFRLILSKAEGVILNEILAKTGVLLLLFSLLVSIGWIL